MQSGRGEYATTRIPATFAASVADVPLGGSFIACLTDDLVTQCYLEHAFATGWSLCHTEFEVSNNRFAAPSSRQRVAHSPRVRADAAVLACSLQTAL